MSMERPRTVSGMRPTGPLHLGHYFGVLKNYVALQHSEEAYFFVADWHALTSDYADPSNIRQNIAEMVKDWVAAGLDPAQCVIFRQSAVKEHAELSLLLSTIFRLFGALLSGLLVTELVYYYFALSFVLPVAVAVAFTLLHALIQAYVLTTLTALFYGEMSEPIRPKEKKNPPSRRRAGLAQGAR